MKKSEFNHRLFSFFLCEKIASPPKETNLWIQKELGEWVLYIHPNNSFETLKFSPIQTIVFIGEVFSLNKSRLDESEGHYVAFLFDHKEQSLKIFRNKSSHIGVYYSEDCTSSCFWGDFMWAHSHISQDWSIDNSAVENFFEFGLITNGETLFSRIKQLPFQKYIQYKNGKIHLLSEGSTQECLMAHESTSSIFEFLIDRIHVWIKHCHFRSIALSGGADSRMLFAALYKNKNLNNIPVHSRLHPKLSEEQDADFVIAKNICEYFGFKHSTQKAQSNPSAYLSQGIPAVPPIFSGLYGGEYLGGEVVNLIDTRHPLIAPHGRLLENSICLLAQAFTCDFYGGAWFPIFSHHNLTLTPFWDSKIIEYLLSLEAEDVKNYTLYNKILVHLPDPLLSFPFQSQLTDYHKRWPQPPAPLVNPKSISISNPTISSHLYDFIPTKYHSNNAKLTSRLNTLNSLFNTFGILNQ